MIVIWIKVYLEIMEKRGYIQNIFVGFVDEYWIGEGEEKRIIKEKLEIVIIQGNLSFYFIKGFQWFFLRIFSCIKKRIIWVLNFIFKILLIELIDFYI